jgi:hypothetical protein
MYLDPFRRRRTIRLELWAEGRYAWLRPESAMSSAREENNGRNALWAGRRVGGKFVDHDLVQRLVRCHRDEGRGAWPTDSQILTARHDHLPFAQDAAAVPDHCASVEHIARILERFGKTVAAAHIHEKLPDTKPIRSGDLGEILATEYNAEQTSYRVPIKRLRWKDHRNMAMRGDDVISIERQPGYAPSSVSEA